MLRGFEEVGHAMLMAEQGRQDLNAMMARALGRWIAGLRGWVAGMPSTMPPTESVRR